MFGTGTLWLHDMEPGNSNDLGAHSPCCVRNECDDISYPEGL